MLEKLGHSREAHSVRHMTFVCAVISVNKCLPSRSPPTAPRQHSEAIQYMCEAVERGC